MHFDPPLEEVVFLQRYKRFLTDVSRPSGEIITIHCPNSGSMRNCQPVNGRAWMSDSKNPKRKLRHTLEMVEVDGALCGINTHRANALAEEAIRRGRINSLTGYQSIRREVRYGLEKSRIDLLLSTGDTHCYVEVKNVTMGSHDGIARFPDAVTTRGRKHLRELCEMVKMGHRAVLLFCGSRSDTRVIKPADDIDPQYGTALRAAQIQGVEIMAYGCRMSPKYWVMEHPLQVDLS